MGSKAMACLMAELSAPLLRRFSLFQVDTRILLAKETNKQTNKTHQMLKTEIRK